MRSSTSIGTSGLALILMSGTLCLAQGGDPYSDLPSTVKLPGVVRDFQERTEAHGHVDFEKKPGGGFGMYFGIVEDELDAEDKPVFRSAGHKRTSNWTDSDGHPMIPSRPYIDAMPGDHAGSMSGSTGDAVTNSSSLLGWFRDVPGTNVSMGLDVVLRRQPGTNLYVFDDKADPLYQSLGGFFPINNKLFGNSHGESKNFHFTYELRTKFQYNEGENDIFRFIGDDDVWVFVDGKLVIDIGGVHSAESQTIDIDRLNWLVDGQTYNLNFFFAERHRTQSNFRIETTLLLQKVEPQTTSALHD